MENFKSSICKLKETKVHKITNSYGVYDAYKYYRKVKPLKKEYVLSESQYFSIIRKVNLAMVDRLLSGKDITFPSHMGAIEVRKAEMYPRERNGKLKITYPVNWVETLNLWETDEEARSNKTLVRYYTPVAYMIKYIKRRAVFKHKSYYDFKPNRTLKRSLANKIKQGNFEAFEL